MIGIARSAQRRGSSSARPRFNRTHLTRSTVHGASANASCPVVYFLDYDVIDDGHVVSQVGRKSESKPVPVCFCFGHTAAAIAADLAQYGRSTIKESVKDAVAGGLCACEHLNPAGACCLSPGDSTGDQQPLFIDGGPVSRMNPTSWAEPETGCEDGTDPNRGEDPFHQQ